MPDEIVAALGRIAAALPPVDWPEPDEIRRLARVRQRRRGLLATFVSVLLVAGAAGVVRTGALSSAASAPNSSPSSTASTCPGGLVPARLALPDFGEIKVNLYNGTTREALAGQIGAQLRLREVNVLLTANAKEPYGGVALIRYGPDAVGAAWVMRSLFADDAQTTFDINRPTDTVDVVLGETFQNLATPTEVNRSIALLGRAVAPPGTCGVG